MTARQYADFTRTAIVLVRANDVDTTALFDRLEDERSGL